MGLIALSSLYVYFKTTSYQLAILNGSGILITFFILRTLIRNIRNNRIRKSGIQEIDLMNGLKFEEFLSQVFITFGYKTMITKASMDFGADLVIKKDGIKSVVQSKRYSSKVGIKSVQEVVSAKSFYNADKAMVVTNSYFTKSAVQLAKANHVELIDRDILIKMLNQIRKKESESK